MRCHRLRNSGSGCYRSRGIGLPARSWQGPIRFPSASIDFSGVAVVVVVAPPTASEEEVIPSALPLPTKDAISSDEEELFRPKGLGTLMRKGVGFADISHEIDHLFGSEDHDRLDYFASDCESVALRQSLCRSDVLSNFLGPSNVNEGSPLAK
jgi:hypothetical protein